MVLYSLTTVSQDKTKPSSEAMSSNPAPATVPKKKINSLAECPMALRSSLDADVMPQLARISEHYREGCENDYQIQNQTSSF